MPNQIVVAGALISDSSLLVAQRARPPELAGLWELPGGKAAAGESDAAALARELHEELGVDVAVGARIGEDVMLNATTTLRAYLVTQTAGTVQPNDHRALRWVRADELDSLAWVPADRAWIPALSRALRGDEVVVRPAADEDRDTMATVIVHAYRRDFSRLARNPDTMAAALATAIDVERFFVAERHGQIIGTIACTDRTGRAMRIDTAAFQRRLGRIHGLVAARILKSQFESALDHPAATGYLEFVAVAETARRQGIATILVDGVIAQTHYPQYDLEVTDVNTAARDCYVKIGFVETHRVRQKLGALVGFRERIYMRYTRPGV